MIVFYLFFLFLSPIISYYITTIRDNTVKEKDLCVVSKNILCYDQVTTNYNQLFKVTFHLLSAQFSNSCPQMPVLTKYSSIHLMEKPFFSKSQIPYLLLGIAYSI